MFGSYPRGSNVDPRALTIGTPHFELTADGGSNEILIAQKSVAVQCFTPSVV